MLLAQYGRPAWALAGPVFLALTPRFMGQVPLNPLDPAFAVLTILSLWALHSSFLQVRPLWRTLVLGLLFGLTCCVRIAGLSLFFVFVLYESYGFFRLSGKSMEGGFRDKLKVFLPSLVLVFLVSGFVLAVFWPYLGEDFFLRLKNAVFLTAHFPYDVRFIFMGHVVSSLSLPWYYLPVWLLVSTPLFLLFFAAGALVWTRRRGQNDLWVLLLTALGVNLALVLFLRPVVYLGMRHFLYFLPMLAAMAALSVIEFCGQFSKRKWARILLLLAVLDAGGVLVECARLHPYEYIYFNRLAGGLPGAYGKFEIEYMATSTKEAVEWIKAHPRPDSPGPTRIFTFQEPFQALYYLDPSLKLAKGLGDADDAIILPAEGKHWLHNRLVYSVSREGVPLMDIYQK